MARISPFIHRPLLLCLALVLASCHGIRHTMPSVTVLAEQGLSEPIADKDVEAWCTPPIGWKRESLKQDDRHTHQVWRSPSGKTAYGVIHFGLPLPVGADFVLPAFISEMKKKEGDAAVLSREEDPNLPGVRFVCEGGVYKMRCNLIASGFTAWVVYAGTYRGDAEVPEELRAAESAREHTVVGDVDGKQ